MVLPICGQSGVSDSVTAVKNPFKKSSIRNTKVACKTTDQIRRGDIGPTSFKVSDLFIPGTSKQR